MESTLLVAFSSRATYS